MSRHLDGNRTNNAADNLVWGSQLANVQDMAAHGTMPQGRSHGMSKLNAQAVTAIRWLHHANRVHQSRLAAAYGVSQSCIQQVCEIAGGTWNQVPYPDSLLGILADRRGKRYCKRCDSWKPLAEFHVNARRCKPCARAASTESYRRRALLAELLGENG